MTCRAELCRSLCGIIMLFGFNLLHCGPWTVNLAGGLGGTNHFLVHGDGGTEEDEEGGSQKGEAQE